MIPSLIRRLPIEAISHMVIKELHKTFGTGKRNRTFIRALEVLCSLR